MSKPIATGDGSETFDIECFMLTQAWTCILDTPSDEQNVLYKHLVTSESILEQLASVVPLHFAPNLSEVLLNDVPPTIDDFIKLPMDAVRGWGV